MLDSLGEFFQANNQRLAQQGVRPGQQSTAGIAGRLIASGVMPQDAYVKAAEIFRGQEQSNIARQKQEAEQIQKHQYSQLADYIRSNPEASNQELTAYALSNGVNPANIGQLINAVGVQEKIVNDPLYGAQIYTNRGGIYEPKNSNSSNRKDINSPMNTTSNTSNITTNEEKPLNRVEAKEKFKSDLRKQEFEEKEDKKYFDELAANSKLAGGLIDKYTQMEELIPKVYSAPGAALKAGAIKITGLNKQKVADFEQFRALAGDVVFDLLATQKGVQTNEDREKMAETKPGPENTQEGNIAIARSRKAMLKRNLEYNRAAEEWRKQGGSKTEFEQKWEQYVAKNPLLSRDKNGVLKVKPENLSNWREYIFGEEKSQETPAEIFKRRFGEDL